MQLSLQIHSFIHYEDLYSASSRLLLRRAPGPRMAKRDIFRARVQCIRMNTGDCRVKMEVHSTREDQPPRMQGSASWKYGQKVRRVPPLRPIEWSGIVS